MDRGSTHSNTASCVLDPKGGLIPAESLILSEGKLGFVFNDRLSLHKNGPQKKKLHSE